MWIYYIGRAVGRSSFFLFEIGVGSLSPELTYALNRELDLKFKSPLVENFFTFVFSLQLKIIKYCRLKSRDSETLSSHILRVYNYVMLIYEPLTGHMYSDRWASFYDFDNPMNSSSATLQSIVLSQGISAEAPNHRGLLPFMSTRSYQVLAMSYRPRR